METRILLAEDCLPTARMIRVFLARLGFESDHVSSGDQAVALVQGIAYDGILMDIGLDGLDGLAAAKQIRVWERVRRLPRMPIIGISAFDAARQAPACFSAGMDAYLAKPFTLDDLKGLLENMLHVPLGMAA